MKSWIQSTKIRVQERVLQALGVHQGTPSEEFDRKLKFFMETISDLNRILEAMQLWIKSLDILCNVAVNLSEAISSFYAKGEEMSPYHELAGMFAAVHIDVKETLIPNIKNVFTDRCIRPITFMLTFEKRVTEKVTDRRRVLLEYDSFKAKKEYELSTGKDASHPNVLKASAKADNAWKICEKLENEILAIIGEFEDNRAIMLGPEFAAVVACFYCQSFTTSNLLSQLLPFIPQTASTLCILSSVTSPSMSDSTDNLTGSAKSKTKQTSADSITASTTEQAHIDANAHLSREFHTMRMARSLRKGGRMRSVPPVLSRISTLGGTVGGYGLEASKNPHIEKWSSAPMLHSEAEHSHSRSLTASSVEGILSNVAFPTIAETPKATKASDKIHQSPTSSTSTNMSTSPRRNFPPPPPRPPKPISKTNADYPVNVSTAAQPPPRPAPALVLRIPPNELALGASSATPSASVSSPCK